MAEPAPNEPFDFKATITELVKRAGSDLHIKVGRPPMLRIRGDLIELKRSPLKPAQLKALAEQIMTPRQV
ncbi:MAG: type IV pili twitching motility protein PilT, partial [Gemmatimonadetes bacterium]|nr:type IV pili twitching motility protein PilT [Gemmatimonadota bacterium]